MNYFSVNALMLIGMILVAFLTYQVGRNYFYEWLNKSTQ